MTLSKGDLNVVSNVRGQLKEQVARFSDEVIAGAWKEFSQSEDYPEMEKFPDWCDMYKEMNT